MMTEQLQAIAWLIIGVIFGVSIAYSMWRRKLEFPVYRAWLLLLFISLFVVDSLEGHTLWVMFAWASSIIGLTLAFDILASWGKELDQKLVIGSILMVTVAGGILVNVYIFSMPSNVAVRMFFLAVFVLAIAPVVVAFIAYLNGKKELSKKLLNFGYLRGMKNET
jgi:hypothetical protein